MTRFSRQTPGKIFCKVFAQKIEDLTFEDVKCLKMLKIPEDL